jgi:hypothetical protein
VRQTNRLLRLHRKTTLFSTKSVVRSPQK